MPDEFQYYHRVFWSWSCHRFLCPEPKDQTLLFLARFSCPSYWVKSFWSRLCWLASLPLFGCGEPLTLRAMTCWLMALGYFGIQYGAGNCKIRSLVKFDFIFENLTWKLNTSFFNCIIAFSGKSILGYCISDFFCTAVHKPFCSQDLNINNYLCHSYLKAWAEN